MTLRYQCERCSNQFSRDEAIEREEVTPSEFWGVREVHTDVTLCCPQCGSDELDPYYDEDDTDEHA